MDKSVYNQEMDKIDLKKAINLSHQLAIIVERDFVPDVIITIKNGGILPGVEISEKLGKPLLEIDIRRIIDDTFEKRYSGASENTRKMISKDFNEVWFATDPKIVKVDKLDLKDKKVLLVDDAVHTGKTLDIAKSYLSTFKPWFIKTAALFYADKYVPDYVLGHGEKQYPWSTWAKFNEKYKVYEEYLKKHKRVLSCAYKEYLQDKGVKRKFSC